MHSRPLSLEAGATENQVWWGRGLGGTPWGPGRGKGSWGRWEVPEGEMGTLGESLHIESLRSQALETAGEL